MGSIEFRSQCHGETGTNDVLDLAGDSSLNGSTKPDAASNYTADELSGHDIDVDLRHGGSQSLEPPQTPTPHHERPI